MFRRVDTRRPGLTGPILKYVVVRFVAEHGAMAELAIAAGVISTPALAASVGDLRDGDGLDGPVAATVKAVHGNAAVDDGPVIDVVIVDDSGPVENLRLTLMVGAVIARMTVAKPVGRDEGEIARFQTEIKTNRNGGAPI